jgi:hypothetical protein
MRPPKTGLNATEVATLLTEYGWSKGYIRAAENLTAVAEPLDRLVAEDRLRELLCTAKTSRGADAAGQVAIQWQVRCQQLYTAGAR